MANQFQPGHLLPVKFTPDGAPETTYRIRGYSAEFSTLLIDVTHTGSGGVRARIGGPRDFRGTVNMSFDLDEPSYDGTRQLRDGVIGVMYFAVSTALDKFIQVPCIIEKVRYESAIENELRLTADVAMNSLAGTLAYPS